MQKLIGYLAACFMKSLAVAILVLAVLPMFATPAAAEKFADQDLSVTAKLPPQWLGAVIYKSSANPQMQTVPVYYKVSATVPGIGETKASPVTTAYTATGPLVSSNSLRIMWAPVDGAESYTLYKSVDDTSYYLMTNTTLLTYIDIGATVGAAFSEGDPRGGNLVVENDADIGGDVTVVNLTVSGTLSPYSTGTFTADGVSVTYGVAAATGVFSGAVTAGTSFTATTSLDAGTSVGAATTVTGGTGVIATAGPVRLYSRTIAQIMLLTANEGDMFKCSDCSPERIAISTGTGAPNTGGFGDAMGLQLD